MWTPMPSAFRKRFSALKTDWKILWPSMHFQCWMREKSHLPTWLRDWIVKSADVPAWLESFRMKVLMFVWWQRISWNTPRTGLSPEHTSARNPLRQRCSLQLNSIFQESFLRTSLDAVVRYPDQIRYYVNPPAPLPLYSPRSFPRSRDKRWSQRYCYPTASTKLLLRLPKTEELQTVLIVIFWFLFSFPPHAFSHIYALLSYV